MPRHIPFYADLLGEDGATTNEVLLYGLIEAASFSEGFCYASSEYMANQLGIVVGTVRNLLSKLAKRGWISVEVEGNKRIAITPLLGLSVKKDRSKKPVENSKESVIPELRKRHSKITLPSFQNDTRNREKTGVGIINNNNIIKEKNKEKKVNDLAGSAGNRPASQIKRQDFETERQYEAAFYRNRTIYLDAI